MTGLTRFMWCLAVVAVAGITVGGCKDKDKGTPTKSPTSTAKAHDHPDHGPNGGTLAEWGEEKYHAEFTADHDKKQATVYILGEDAKTYAPIDAATITLKLTNTKPPVEIALKADPQKGDPEGKSSRFVGTDDALAAKMEFQGVISGKVGDTPYSGKFEEKEHKK